jgi:hypothetical protein
MRERASKKAFSLCELAKGMPDPHGYSMLLIIMYFLFYVINGRIFYGGVFLQERIYIAGFFIQFPLDWQPHLKVGI